MLMDKQKHCPVITSQWMQGSPEPQTPPPGHHLRKKKRKSFFFFNGRKIARIAPILTIFGPKSSQRRDLFLKIFRTNEKTKKHAKKPIERAKNRIVQVVVIVGRVSGFRENYASGNEYGTRQG